MPEIRPFAAIRFNPKKFSTDLSGVLAPPYDVLNEEDKARLLSQNPRNIVAIDLPHVPPKSVGPLEAYERSAQFLHEWLEDATLFRDSQPALYAYHQTFLHDGRTYTRRKFICSLRLSAFSEGTVLPHEKTFGGPKEDRLALMRTTRCNLSPIFGLYPDPNRTVDEALERATQREADVYGTLDGVQNQLWIVTDGGTVRRVVDALAAVKVFIADGHHRYETALKYRDEVLAAQTLPENHPARFVMFVLASMDDPGCLILPYNRVLLNRDLNSVLEAWQPGIEVCDAVRRDLTLHEGSTGREVHVRFTARSRLALFAPAECSAWHCLDLAYIHRYLIDELLSKRNPDSEKKIAYVKSRQEATRTARLESGVALLVKPTPMEQLRAVSEAGGVMPQKSTFFYPKLATGLTIHPLQ